MSGAAGFVVRLAARETRTAWRRLLVFFLCVALGVGAIIALRSVIQNVREALAGEARTLTAADVVIRTNRPWTDRALDILADRLAPPAVAERTDSIDASTMVRPADEGRTGTRMVELRGVEPGFPLYGDIVLASGRPYAHALLRGRGVLVRPELLAQLGLEVGDGVIIGRDRFVIRDVVLLEAGRRVGAFALGTPVLVDYDDLLATGLVTVGSRVTREIRLRVPEPAMGRLVERLQQDLADEFVTVRSYRQTEDRLGDDLTRAENYLSLVGFVILILGGVGVWSVTRVFVRQKLKSIAILKCLGATTRLILAAYVLQVLVLGLAGSGLGAVLAAVVVALVPPATTGALAGISYALTPSAVWQGIGVGVMVSLLFSLVPLLEIRRVRPLLLLREGLGHAAAGGLALDGLQVAAGVLLAGGLVALAGWQAGSWRVGAYVCAGFAVAAIVLHGASVLLMRVVAPLARTRSFALRHAVLGLARPGNQTRVILLAVGLGSFFIIGVQSIQGSLLRALALEMRPEAPDLFLLDIQPDQVDGVRRIVASDPARDASMPEPRLIPVLRARVTAVRGRDVSLDGFGDVRGRGGLGREYVVTYRAHLERNERVLEGRFWPDARAGEPEVSIEKGLRERHGIRVGDRIRFDILGRALEARVASVRQVDWDDARSGGFMFVFRPGPLDGAPHTYIGLLKGPGGVAARQALQRRLVDAFPNVSAIDGLEVLATVRTILGSVTLAISAVGLVALLSGALILIGSVAMTRFQRMYEAAIFKTLGASTRMLGTMLVLEYSALGLVAGTIGAAGGAVLGWAVTRYLLEIAWRPAPELAIAGLLLTAALVVAAGVLASLDVVRRRPLGTLRAE